MISRIKNTTLRRLALVAYLPIIPCIAIGYGLRELYDCRRSLADDYRRLWKRT